MVNLVKIISTELNEISQRIVKFLRYGKNDVQTCREAGPYGIDSNPIKDMVAVYAPSMTKGKPVIIGYLNKNQLSEVGETRLYSTNDAGELQNYIWLKNTGVIEIGGDADFMVRYSKLEEAFNDLQDKFNTFAAAYVPGSPSTTGLPATIAQSTGDITLAKINEIKTS